MAKLGDMWHREKFEFVVIYGRRRVGKTTLFLEVVKGKNALFFAASESRARYLVALSRCIGGNNSAPVFMDYESALSAVFELARQERMAFVIDVHRLRNKDAEQRASGMAKQEKIYVAPYPADIFTNGRDV
jgi:AAA+ ATPase superfamily predicted ATPase